MGAAPSASGPGEAPRWGPVERALTIPRRSAPLRGRRAGLPFGLEPRARPGNLEGGSALRAASLGGHVPANGVRLAVEGLQRSASSRPTSGTERAGPVTGRVQLRDRGVHASSAAASSGPRACGLLVSRRRRRRPVGSERPRLGRPRSPAPTLPRCRRARRWPRLPQASMPLDPLRPAVVRSAAGAVARAASDATTGRRTASTGSGHRGVIGGHGRSPVVLDVRPRVRRDRDVAAVAGRHDHGSTLARGDHFDRRHPARARRGAPPGEPGRRGAERRQRAARRPGD